MPSTYTTNNKFEKPNIGEQSGGTWGTSLNNDLDLLDSAIDGSVSIAISGTTTTLNIPDALSADGRNKVLLFTGSLAATNTITVTPNTVKKVYFVQNNTTGGQSIVIAQGSGSTVTVKNGYSSIVYLDGAGAGAAAKEILTSLKLTSLLEAAGTVLVGAVTGATTLQASSTASGTLTLPAATDTLVGRATTDTLTNKTYDTAGTGNVLRINGTQVSSVTGTGAVVLAASPTMTGTATVSGTLQAYDSTPTTGVTQSVIRAGAGQSSTNLTEWRNSANTVLSVVTAGGNMGLGTGTPLHRLDVRGTSSRIFNGNPVVDTRFDIGNADEAFPGQGLYFIFHGSAATPYASINVLSQAVAWRNLAIAPLGGTVSIGTTSATTKLDIFCGSFDGVRINDGTVDGRFLNGGGTSVLVGSISNHPLVLWANNAERARIEPSGNVKVGGTADRATTAGTNQVVIFNGTAPVGTLTNGCSFYSTAGEMRVMDAAGNATLLSPHDSISNEWIYDSTHTPTGKRLRIDVEKLLRFLNDHFGLDCIQEFIEP